MRMLGRGWSGMLLGLALLVSGCKDTTQAPTSLAYATNPAVYTQGVAITANGPTSSGGAIDSYAVSPALPSGLSLNAATGVITGTPTAAAIATYTVTGTNKGGSTSVGLSITVNALSLLITTQPADQSTSVGQTATFSVVATGTGTLSYQWSRGGLPLVGAIQATYTTPAVLLADNGSTYTVQVSDGFGNHVTSTPATLTVLSTAGPGTCIATLGDMSTGRSSHTATLLPSGQVLIAGGGAGGSFLGTAELYDPATESFTLTTGGLNTAREFHTATLLQDGTVLIAGGNSSLAATASAEIYNPATGTFTPTTGSLQAARQDHTATLLPSGKVLLVGGRDQTVIVTTAELYDPGTGTFTTTTNAPLVARTTHTATLLGTGKVLLAGGFLTANLASAELYDPTAGTFTATGSLSTPRAYHTATPVSGGKVLMVGGAATAVAELYDPTAGTFSTAGSLLTARVQFHAAALLATGKVLITGGLGTGSPAPLLSTAELFDPANGTFAATGSMTQGREHHTATLLGNGKTLLTGGVVVGSPASAELYF